MMGEGGGVAGPSSRRESKLLEGLNPVQREAVCHLEGPLLVLAGAGSGKTRVLAHKVAYLVEQGVSPGRILAVTFTNKAAREMRDRIEGLLGGSAGEMAISTFHSFGLRFLQRHGDALEARGWPRRFTIFDRQDSRALVKDLLAELEIDPQRLDPSGALERLSSAKGEASVRTLEAPAMDPALNRLFRRYQECLREQGALDFDDLLLLPLHLLTVEEEVRQREQRAFDWVLVDEYQDVNRLQYLTLRKLVEGKEQLVAVGDPDQSIYGWRGADMGMILRFSQDFPRSRTVVLDQNYRSSGVILDAANALIDRNAERPKKNLWTARDRGEPVRVLLVESERDEASFIASEIEALRGQGYRYGDMAILYRLNALSRGIEQLLFERRIPYRVVRGTAFYDRREIKDVISFLRLAINPRDGAALGRCANLPPRGIGARGVERLGAWLAAEGGNRAEDVWRRLAEEGAGLTGKGRQGARELGAAMEALGQRRDDVPGAVDYVLNEMGYEAFLRAEEGDSFEERRENIQELLSLVPDGASLDSVLGEIALYTDAELASDKEDAVGLLTLHAAKGLEFPVVFLAALEESIFPHARCVEMPGGIEEERRLCYVGMTRAEERLYLSGARSRLLFGTVQRHPFSRFLRELPPGPVALEDRTGRKESFHAGFGSHRGYRRW